MPNTNAWDKAIDWLQAAMLWFLVIVVAVCVLTLILFDILVGAGVMMYLTGENLEASIFISLATSGLLIALMVIGYMLMDKDKKGMKGVGIGVLLLALGVYGLDIFFDSLTADYLRFGTIISLDSLIENEQMIHMLFRALIGGISTIGESLAMAIIVGMPVLKEIINNALPDRYSSTVKRSVPRASLTSRQTKKSPKFQLFSQEILDQLPKDKN